MTPLTYCKKCILPTSRPNLSLDKNGICSACNSTTSKASVDWDQRKYAFECLVHEVKSYSAPYDCVIPVSGGKDSTWQVVTALQHGLNPLCVTWKSPARNSLGAQNLQNLISLGVNHIDFSINPRVEKIFTLKAFKRFGSPVIPMHMALHALPLQVAVSRKIPLVLWAENSAVEYGGDDNKLKGFFLNHSWLKKYGVTNGTTSDDWIDDDLTKTDLEPYRWPSDREQVQCNVKATFLGEYFNWDPLMAKNVATENGFKSSLSAKTGLYKFADIDDAFLITIHHWMKWYKFGFTRLWDNLSLEIRNKRISRDEAIEIVRAKGEEKPLKEIDMFCEYVDISTSEFYDIAESFRNLEIWQRNLDGEYQIPSFLISDWSWK